MDIYVLLRGYRMPRSRRDPLAAEHRVMKDSKGATEVRQQSPRIDSKGDDRPS